MQQPKITLATFKSFLKKNSGNLQINVKSTFDGMTDGMERVTDGFSPAQPTEAHSENTLGYSRIWLVGHGGDRFSTYEDETRTGIEVYNSCGSFIVAIDKPRDLANRIHKLLDAVNKQRTRKEAQGIASGILSDYGVIAQDNDNLSNLPAGEQGIALVNELEDLTKFTENGITYCYTIEQGTQLAEIEL